MTINRVAYEVETSGADGLPEHIDYLRVTNQARIAYDLQADKNNWPAAKDAQFLWVAYTVWKQLVHEGRFPEYESGGKVSTFKRFREDVLIDFEDRSDDPRKAPEADPTDEARPLGGASTSPPPPASTSTASTEQPTPN